MGLANVIGAEFTYFCRCPKIVSASEVVIVEVEKFRLTHEILGEINRSEIWKSYFGGSIQLSAEDIYGPEGKLQWIWNSSWVDGDDMRSDLCENMGGGVPIEIIEELIRITEFHCGQSKPNN